MVFRSTRRIPLFSTKTVVLLDYPDHSDEDERFLLLAYSFQARCLIVSHCYRESGTVIRLISASPATVNEEAI